METTHKINQYIVTLTGKEEANLLFIGTASHDADDSSKAYVITLVDGKLEKKEQKVVTL